MTVEYQKPGFSYALSAVGNALLDRHLIRDSVGLFKHFYGNTASFTSKILGVSLKHIGDLYIFYETPISKDANPTTGNAIREAMNLVPNSINAGFGAKHTKDGHEIQDLTHLGGQTLRLLCKTAFLASTNITSEDSIYVAGLSNMACDSIGVMGQQLSKLSQPKDVSERLYYLWPDPSIEKNIYGFSFLKEKLTPGYITQNVFAAAFKAGTLCQLGETIKLGSTLSPIMITYNITESAKNIGVSYFFGVSNSVLEAKYINVYDQREAIFKEVNNDISGYLINAILESYQLSRRVALDLYVTGPALLSTSNDAIKYYESLGMAESILNLGVVGLAFHYKADIFSHISNITPELLTMAAGMLASNDLYDALVQSHPGVKLALAGTAFAYAHFKQDIHEYMGYAEQVMQLPGVDAQEAIA